MSTSAVTLTPLDLETVELVSTLRTAPQNGAPSSADYYDGELEKLTDLSTLATFINNVLLPILNALPNTAATGLEGTTCYSDTTSQDALVYDSLTGDSLCVTDSMRLLYGQLQTLQTSQTNLSQQVLALQARLSASSQDDISLALQSITNTLAQDATQIRSLTSTISVLQLLVGAEADVPVQTPAIAAGGSTSVTVAWPVAFSNNSYSVSYSLEDASGFLLITGFSYSPNGVGITVNVKNTDTAVAHQGTVHSIGRANTSTGS